MSIKYAMNEFYETSKKFAYKAYGFSKKAGGKAWDFSKKTAREAFKAGLNRDEGDGIRHSYLDINLGLFKFQGHVKTKNGKLYSHGRNIGVNLGLYKNEHGQTKDVAYGTKKRERKKSLNLGRLLNYKIERTSYKFKDSQKNPDKEYRLYKEEKDYHSFFGFKDEKRSIENKIDLDTLQFKPYNTKITYKKNILGGFRRKFSQYHMQEGMPLVDRSSHKKYWRPAKLTRYETQGILLSEDKDFDKASQFFAGMKGMVEKEKAYKLANDGSAQRWKPWGTGRLPLVLGGVALIGGFGLPVAAAIASVSGVMYARDKMRQASLEKKYDQQQEKLHRTSVDILNSKGKGDYLVEQDAILGLIKTHDGKKSFYDMGREENLSRHFTKAIAVGVGIPALTLLVGTGTAALAAMPFVIAAAVAINYARNKEADQRSGMTSDRMEKMRENILHISKHGFNPPPRQNTGFEQDFRRRSTTAPA